MSLLLFLGLTAAVSLAVYAVMSGLRGGVEDRIGDLGGSGEVWCEETGIMPRPYSADLRERVLAACERREGTREAIARRFRVAASTVYGWLRLARETGRRTPKPHEGGRPPVGGEAAVLAELVAERNDATLAEHAARPAERTGIRRSPSALCRALKALGLGRKKRRSGRPSRSARTSPRHAGRGERSWPGSIPGASSSSTRPASTPAWRGPTPAPRAGGGRPARAPGEVPWGRRERLTVVGALALDGGVIASMSIAAATGTAVFLAFVVEQVLAPALRDRPGAIVIMDNLPARKAEAVRDALDRAGLRHRHPPPYSPDPNPIEQAWSKLKTRLRAEGARSREALEQALGPALAAITARDARGWFRLCGYPAPD